MICLHYRVALFALSFALAAAGCTSRTAATPERKLQLVEVRHFWGPPNYIYRREEARPALVGGVRIQQPGAASSRRAYPR